METGLWQDRSSAAGTRYGKPYICEFVQQNNRMKPDELSLVEI